MRPKPDHERDAQAAAEAHLAACNEALWAYDEDGVELDSPAIGPYCGCDTCVVREVLWAAWEHLTSLKEEEARKPPPLSSV